MRFFQVQILGLALLLCSFSVHKYYMSIAHLKYNVKQEALQITLRIFIDDLQFDLNKKNQNNIELATKREPPNIDSIYENYLKINFNIEVNNKIQNTTFIGKEYTDDMVVCYLEILNIKSIKQLKIENKILYQSFPEQENIVKLNIHNKNKSYILTRNQPVALMNY